MRQYWYLNSDHRDLPGIQREAQVLQKLSHPHVTKYHEVFLHKEDGELFVCIATEFCSAGDLSAHLTTVKGTCLNAQTERHLHPVLCGWVDGLDGGREEGRGDEGE